MEAWEFITVFFIGATVGLFIGQWISDWKWRKNANEVVRIYSGGKLFKVREE